MNITPAQNNRQASFGMAYTINGRGFTKHEKALLNEGAKATLDQTSKDAYQVISKGFATYTKTNYNETEKLRLFPSSLFGSIRKALSKTNPSFVASEPVYVVDTYKEKPSLIQRLLTSNFEKGRAISEPILAHDSDSELISSLNEAAKESREVAGKTTYRSQPELTDIINR